MSKFKVGERARFTGEQNVYNACAKYAGQVVTVIRHPASRQNEHKQDYDIKADDGFEMCVVESLLRKLLPDSDSYQRSTWRDFKDALRDAQKTPQTIKE